ncbi:MAG: hypothetical protein P4L43_00390 [Syntrophobacteraceae bacterium]|nr:hypothetical protein [Syntrophobacteraceae bacterium]
MGFKTLTQRKFFILAAVIFLLIATAPQVLPAVETNQATARSIRRDVELEALQNGMKAFDSGQYEKAQTTFEMLSGLAKNPDIRRRALFGLASTKLVLADSQGAYNSAVATWEKWAAEAKPSNDGEDARMITPFLLNLQSAIGKGCGGPLGAKEKAKHDDFPRIVIMREKVVQALRAKLRLAERQIVRLRHDLRSLDEIHRKYEEKKQEITP